MLRVSYHEELSGTNTLSPLRRSVAGSYRVLEATVFHNYYIPMEHMTHVHKALLRGGRKPRNIPHNEILQCNIAPIGTVAASRRLVRLAFCNICGG